jgi:hypothetical protein
MKNAEIEIRNRLSLPRYFSMHVLVSAIALVMLGLVVTDIAPTAQWLASSSEDRDRDFAELLAEAPSPYAPALADANRSAAGAPQ